MEAIIISGEILWRGDIWLDGLLLMMILYAIALKYMELWEEM